MAYLYNGPDLQGIVTLMAGREEKFDLSDSFIDSKQTAVFVPLCRIVLPGVWESETAIAVKIHCARLNVFFLEKENHEKSLKIL